MTGETHHGACLCGSTAFEVAGSLDDVVICHCSQCRRANGAAFNVAVVVPSAAVEFSSRAQLREFESSPGKLRAFCGGCGCPIYSRLADDPETLRLRGGTIVDLPRPANLRQIWWNDRWPWIDTVFDTPRYEKDVAG